tara:strand:+ start:731 stop:1138 length:408 start_codon:yes stop_codon:yes gene_type:complete
MALPSLKTDQVRKIEGLIQGWTTKLTWDLLIGRIESDFAIKTTRQTLNTYVSIKTMYTDKKHKLRGKPSEEIIDVTRSDVELAKTILSLRAQIVALEKRDNKQRAFILEIADQAKSNPLILEVLNRVKERINKNG